MRRIAVVMAIAFLSACAKSHLEAYVLSERQIETIKRSVRIQFQNSYSEKFSSFKAVLSGKAAVTVCGYTGEKIFIGVLSAIENKFMLVAGNIDNDLQQEMWLRMCREKGLI